MLGLPNDKECKVEPGDMGTYELFLESTSHNRVRVRGTDLIVRLDLVSADCWGSAASPRSVGLTDSEEHEPDAHTVMNLVLECIHEQPT